MHPMINIALRAARQAGALIARNTERVSSLNIERKHINDYVTEIDRAAETEIIYHLHKAYPEHSILTEESGLIPATKGNSHDYLWVIDPLDGTQNFINGIPHFAVSIACFHNKKLAHAVIYDPIRNEEFIASRGRGAQLNSKRIRVSEKSKLDGSMLLTGLPALECQQPYREKYLHSIDILQKQFRVNIRNSGSAALNLAYIAAGRADGYWEPRLKKWDVSAGALLIQEAGGFVSDFSGNHTHLETGNTVASNKKCFKPLLQIIQPLLSKIPDPT